MTRRKQLLAKELFEINGPIVKMKVLTENKFCSREVAELVHIGAIHKIKSGYYIWIESENDLSDIATAAGLIPFGAICGYTAAQIYGLSTVNPQAVSVAIPANRTRVILPEYPPIELVTVSRASFDIGLTEIKTEQTTISIYDRERTVCDFFRKRNQMGNDVALEVLQNYMAGQRNLQKLFEYAGKLHIKNVIKPYVEALI